MRHSTIFTLALAILVPGAFAQKVKVDYDRSHNFSSYRTYAWKGGTSTQNDPLLVSGFTARRIQRAADKQPTLTELRKVSTAENLDALFTCWVGNQQRTEVCGTSWGPGWGAGYWGWHGS